MDDEKKRRLCSCCTGLYLFPAPFIYKVAQYTHKHFVILHISKTLTKCLHLVFNQGDVFEQKWKNDEKKISLHKIYQSIEMRNFLTLKLWENSLYRSSQLVYGYNDLFISMAVVECARPLESFIFIIPCSLAHQQAHSTHVCVAEENKTEKEQQKEREFRINYLKRLVHQPFFSVICCRCISYIYCLRRSSLHRVSHHLLLIAGTTNISVFSVFWSIHNWSLRRWN